jgi:hypothetical protein
MIEFKTPQEKEDFNNPRLDNRLKFIVYALDGFVQHNFLKDITITSIWRPKTTDSGVHEANRGVDIRTMYFTESEIAQILEFLSQVEYGLSSSGQPLKTAIYHDVGQGKHLHLQCSNSNLTPILKKTLTENEISAKVVA